MSEAQGQRDIEDAQNLGKWKETVRQYAEGPVIIFHPEPNMVAYFPFTGLRMDFVHVISEVDVGDFFFDIRDIEKPSDFSVKCDRVEVSSPEIEDFSVLMDTEIGTEEYA